MNLETISSPAGDSGTACSLRTLLTLGCRSETGQSFAKRLQTKLCSLNPLPSTTDGLCSRHLAGDLDEEVDASNIDEVIPWRVAEARFDWNAQRVDTVVTTVPIVTSSRPRFTSGIVYQPLNSHQQQKVILYDLLRNGREKSPTTSSPSPDMDSNVLPNREWSEANHLDSSVSMSMVGGAQQDHESDTSSTTNQLSDSDQYFDFGIETPLDLEGAGENQDSIVINQDDGLPVDGEESGCMFGSPTLSDSDETEQEEVSVYESLSQSPAVGILGSSKQVGFERVANGDTGGGAPHVGESAPSRAGVSLSVNSAPAHAERTSLPRDCQTSGADFQGALEDVHECAAGALEDSLCADAVSTEPSSSDAADVPRDPFNHSLDGQHASPVFHDSTLSLDAESTDSGCIETANLDDNKMVRQVIDNLFNGTESPCVKVDALIEAKSPSDLIISEKAAVKSDEITVANDLKSEDEENESEPKSDDSDSTSNSSSSKESTPAREIIVVEDDDEDDDNGQTRRRVQRSTSLKTGKTPPGTPGGKKIVRFADALGLDLAAVRTFLDEIPNVPQSAFNDLSDVEDDSRLQGSAARAAGCNLSQIPAYVPKHNSALTLVATFTQPGQMPDFIDKIKKQKICLETACMVDELRIRGVVRVLNIDFHKTVIVRYTVDEWRTHTDLLTTYVPNSCDGLSDRFSFSLACAPMLQPGQRLIIALCYRVSGQEFWDSNQGRNYIFQCISNSSYTPSIALDPLLHDSFLPYM